MKPEEQIRAIARVVMYPYNICSCGLHWMQSDGVSCGNSISNFTGDLNAMNSAEKVLLGDLKASDEVDPSQPSGKYFMALGDVTERDDHPMFNATAAQRAEAFLKTLNLWVPEKSSPSGDFPVA